MNKQQEITTYYFTNLFWNHWKEHRLINEDKALHKLAEDLANVITKDLKIKDKIYKLLKEYTSK